MASHKKQKAESPVWETVSVVIQALILALILRTFLFQPFNIPSGSMKPTLLVGDYIFVSKYSYGYSRYSLPFGPNIFSGRIWGADPLRGDVVVFKYPPDPSKDYIKRVIGLPGDKVQIQNSTIIINGQPVRREATGTFSETDMGVTLSAQSFRETLDSGISYTALDINTRPGNLVDNTPVFEVPQGHFFFLGDNRDNSLDSRFDVGFVPSENLVGKAQVIFLSLEDGVPAWQFWRWPDKMRWDRLFTGL
ncbi:MAG: signal peptidase I [Pseudomonadota bacterium]